VQDENAARGDRHFRNQAARRTARAEIRQRDFAEFMIPPIRLT
jgi:hypothetical protein